MYADDELSKHNQPSDAWVLYKGKVLDITGFLPTHPGGDSILEPYLGKDITEAFKAADHSESAEGMVESLVIGNTETKPLKIDPYKGTFYQVWTTLDLPSYTEFINSPNCVVSHLRVFDSPYLEFFTMTPWQVIPALWIPIVMYLFYCGFLEIGPSAVPTFFFGIFYWTFYEYILHRFAFHCEQFLPESKYMIGLHYLFHGVHHAYPMDPLRLVFPPVLGISMAVLQKQVFYNAIMPLPFADAFMAGKIVGYIWYDMFHFFSHHSQVKNGYAAFVKRYHLAHHFKDSDLGFGVTTHFWDSVFGTKLILTDKILQVG